MKKTASIMLIFVFLLNSAGLLAVYYFQKHTIRAEFRAYLRSGKEFAETEKITLSEDDMKSNRFKWIESYEFMLDGKMYDIVKSVRTSDSITFYAVNDIKEDQLKQAFRNQNPEAESDYLALLTTITSIQKSLQQELAKISVKVNNFYLMLNNINVFTGKTLSGFSIDIFHPPSLSY